ncbi:hypothetical protein Q604_UNBC07065G0001, partial [human gut metagenome]
NGTYSLTKFAPVVIRLERCFNPCFNGTYSLTRIQTIIWEDNGLF